MKRRITIEVDDAIFPHVDLTTAAQTPQNALRTMAEVELGFLVGPMQVDHQRTSAAVKLRTFGVILVLDEQVD